MQLLVAWATSLPCASNTCASASRRRHTAMPRRVHTNRLALLVDHDILRKQPYQEPGERVRHEYRLTAKGLDLYPVMVAIAARGDRYVADPQGPPVEFAHRGCGVQMGAVLECAAGHRVDDVRQVVPRPGPGPIRSNWVCSYWRRQLPDLAEMRALKPR